MRAAESLHPPQCYGGREFSPTLPGVKKQLLAGFCLCIAGLLLCSQTQADVVVSVRFSGLSPNPVNIVTGEIVYWVDADGGGPYTIFINSQAFQTDFGLQFNQAGTYPYSDDVGDQGTVYVTLNTPPSVTITNPATNAVFSAPAAFDFAADAFDPDPGGVMDVEFYVGTNLVDDVFSSPFTTPITNLSAGTYILTVIAYDSANATATNSITITVQNPDPITLAAAKAAAGKFRFDVTGLTTGKTNVLQASTNLIFPNNWVSIATNVASSSSVSFTNSIVPGNSFFRLLQLP